MAIAFACSGCQKSMTAPDEAAGRKARCKTCQAVTHVPRPLVLEAGEQRAHHYLFAHRFVPQTSFSGGAGAGLLMAMAADPQGGLLRKGWDAVGAQLPRAQRLAPDGLSGSVVEAREGLNLAVVQLPPARRQPEALFVAGAYALDPAGEGMSFRLLTLELGLDMGTGQPQTVLGEWAPTREGGLRHLNWGPGPPDSLTAFASAARALIDKDDAQPHGSLG